MRCTLNFFASNFINKLHQKAAHDACCFSADSVGSLAFGAACACSGTRSAIQGFFLNHLEIKMMRHTAGTVRRLVGKICL
jgi:hypothetical protein